MNDETALRSIRPMMTRAQVVAEQLREAIQSGELPAGTPLMQTEVAKQLGVSTTPVREAFAVLLREGLLVGDPHRGAVVFRPTVADLRENYEIRLALEPLATELAVPNLTEADFEDLDALLDEMRRTKRSVDFLPLNRRFHRRLYEAADRPKLYPTIEELRESAAAYANVFALAEADPSQSQAEHETIVAACRKGNAQAAAEAMRRHLKHIWDVTTRELVEVGSA
jgi:DNA-binding GntR family transcriptional regulator